MAIKSCPFKAISYIEAKEPILDKNLKCNCNDREALEQFGLYDGQMIASEVLHHCGVELARRTGRVVFITRGKLGQLVFDPTKHEAICIPAVPMEGEIDICGAGDATSAALVSSLCVGATPEEAAMIGNLAASVTIRKIGQTGTASPAEVLAAW